MKALTSVKMHDFLHITDRPFQIFFPINANNIDPSAVLETLVPIILNTDGVEQNEVEVRRILKERLNQLLQSISGKHAFSNVAELVTAVQAKLNKRRNPAFPGVVINLNALIQDGVADIVRTGFWIRPQGWGAWLVGKVWLATDISCAASFLKDWNLLDCAKLADQIGQISVFSRIKELDLGVSITTFVCVGFAGNFALAIFALLTENMSYVDRSKAQIQAITSLAELLLCSTHLFKFLDSAGPGIFLLTIVVKSIGALRIFVTPSKVDYFPPDDGRPGVETDPFTPIDVEVKWQGG